MNTSTELAEELAHLQVQIDRTRHKHGTLAGELRVVDAELETFSADRQRFDALREVCAALDRLGGLKADELFWEGIAENGNAAGHLERAKYRLTTFDQQISGILNKRASLQEQVDRTLNELGFLDDEVREAHEREERRQEEYVIEREISPVPYRVAIMPWTRDAENEREFRKALRIALLACFCLSMVILIWKLPKPTRPAVAVVPERLVALLKKERPKPEPPRPKEEKKPDREQEKAPEKPKEDQPKPSTAETQEARKKAESTGVLAFKNAFKDLVEETPVARLGAETRLSNQASAAAGQARASRSLVAMPSGGGSSGGISNAGVSRNIGSGNGNRIGGVGYARVESSIAGLAEEQRPLSSGPGPSRTDEEIQIVFDKYKAALYRIYNTELRKNPTLRGKIILRITIEPGGEVSACTVQSNDLASPELVAQIVERVRKFNFGPKEKVSATTILYPIDFLPGG